MTDRTQSVSEALKHLQSLQAIHNDLRTLEELLEEKPRELHEAQARLDRQRQASSALQEDAKQLQMEIDKFEVDLKDADGKIAKLQEQQNTVKTNREYKAIQDEVDNLRVEMSLVEDKMLDIMAKIEEGSEQQSSADKNLDEEQQRLQRKTQVAQEEIDELQAECQEVRQRRDEIAAQLEPKFLDAFQRLSNIRGGVAVAPVKGQMCGGCFINLTAQTLNALMGAHELTYCHSCGRILYLE